ncbi:MAG: PSD1 and planctomycete cytochrome C domain-containing protein [Pirellulales bacterium]
MLRIVAAATVWTLSVAVVSSAAEPQLPPPSFENEIAPLLTRRCLACHHERDPNGGLVLATRAAALEGGDSGRAIEPGDPDGSYLIERVVSGDMPPEERGQSQQLPEAEIELLRRWIAADAPWPEATKLDLFAFTSDTRAGRDWWALNPIARPEVPEVQERDEVANPIDAFVLARLESAGISPAPLASPRVLVRRLFYDLVGLPPTAEQIEAFAADPSNEAWQRLVDELLASPHYGERWARHWLDVVRFAETSGYERDQEKPFAWRYRDWVVSALNDDMPYDEFVLDQVAGDEVPDRSLETVIGTGFLRLGTWNDEPNDPQDYKYERLEDLVHATSTAFLGLTIKCARCHDHKFDPIPQDDYYRMAAAFWAGPIEPRDRGLLGGPSNEELGFDEVLGWTDVRREPPPLHLLKAGDRHKPDRVVEAEPVSFVPALSSNSGTADAAADADSGDTDPAGSASTGRRLRLARWLVDEQNPLVARVWVNRLWLGHFGEGIVRSPDNFGFQGDPPTHPLLLDWLASELRDHGWSTKHIHRLILTSRTWRQSSLHPEQAEIAERDAGNRFWWRANRQRLDAESLRDSLLAVSGELDLSIGGESFRPTIADEAIEGLSMKGSAWHPSPADEQRRRSLYIYTKRGLLPPMMTSFDMTDTTLPCGRRDVTTAAPQALAMLNNAFAHDRSRVLADRVLEASGDSAGANDGALSRRPGGSCWGGRLTATSATRALAHLAAQARAVRGTTTCRDCRRRHACWRTSGR